MSRADVVSSNRTESAPAESAGTNAGRSVLVLVLIYLAVVLVHVLALDGASRFPHISSDEVQYALTGENLRLGRGFMLRGEMNTSAPPLFPLFVAAVYSVGGDQPREAMLIASSFVMSLAVFIAFPLARRLGIRRDSAYVLAAAVGMSPHTFYAGTHMTEILQYPLFLGSFYAGLLWIERPTLRGDLCFGLLLAATASVKIQTIHLLLALVAAVIITAAQASRDSRREALSILKHSLVVLGIAAVAAGSWLLFKQAQGGQVLGVYGSPLAMRLRFWTPELMLAYLADFLLAAGLVTIGPLLWWFRDTKNFRMSVFCGAVLLIEFGVVSVVDGGLTGLLRERLYMYSLPIMAIFAVAGLQGAPRPLTNWRPVLLPAIPLAVLPLLTLYAFDLVPVIESPWSNAIGSFHGRDFHSFSVKKVVIVSAALICLLSYLLIRLRRAAPLCLSVFILVFYSFGFTGTAVGMARGSEGGIRHITPFIEWLNEHDVNAGDRLVIAGKPTYFQFQAGEWPPDESYLEWNQSANLQDPFIWQLELLGRFDVRTLPAPQFLGDIARPGDAVLTAAQFDGLEAVDAHYPLYLYRMPQTLVATPRASYEVEIPARLFSSQHGKMSRSRAIVGDGSGDHGLLVMGPYFPMPRGTYELTLDIAGDPEMPITVDVYEHPNRTAATEVTTIGNLGALTFSTTGATPLEYRITGAADPYFRFKGVKLRYISGPLLEQ